MRGLKLSLVALVVLFMSGYVDAKSCKNHICNQCGHEECVECPDLICPEIPDCICNGTECPDVTCPEIPECPPDPDCNCPSCPDCICPQEGECPDLVCPEIPDCICNAPECPDCICGDNEEGLKQYLMFGTARLNAAPTILLGHISLYPMQKFGIAYQCLMTGDIANGMCAGYFLLEK